MQPSLTTPQKCPSCGGGGGCPACGGSGVCPTCEGVGYRPLPSLLTEVKEAATRHSTTTLLVVAALSYISGILVTLSLTSVRF